MGQILIYFLTGAAILIVLTLAILIGIFFIATAMYIIPSRQQKIDLKQLASDRVESRIYLDEYKFVLASDKNQKKIDLQVKAIASLESKTRRAAAELKSINAAVERAKKTNPKQAQQVKQASKKEPKKA